MNFIILISSLVLGLSTNNWFTLWVSLEINTLTYLYIAFNYNNISTNSCMKYFIMQTIPSSIFIMIISLNEINTLNNATNTIILLTMMMKLGLGPLYNWLLELTETMNWLGFIMLNTLQKLLPLYIINMTLMNNSFSKSMIIFSSLLSCYMMYNTTSMKKFLAMSSLIHLSWIIYMMMTTNHSWVIYYLMYVFLAINLLFLPVNLHKINQIFYMKSPQSMNMCITMFNFCSMPPMMFFFSKIKAMSFMMNTDLLVMIMLLISSLTSTYIYLAITYQITLNKKMYFLPKNNMTSWNNFNMATIMSMMLLCIIMFL
uniref:NADH-ubiquinone oxidoreductase chain 2 n=1 Tax=Tinaminyssus melloi TaxID=105222 RepID=A0A5Q0RZX0_9ACAR|nr:NADH dehydrogenase subunit 2 [Tinaminyssus melloi]QGA47505.1 NADH dehydrogenase subunit 2 [Tinaminyssus melloi]